MIVPKKGEPRLDVALTVRLVAPSETVPPVPLSAPMVRPVALSAEMSNVPPVMVTAPLAAMPPPAAMASVPAEILVPPV